MSNEVTLETERGPIVAKVRGPEAGKRVLAVHGWLDNADSFEPLAALLPPNWRLVALDLPGHGFSYHRSPGMPYHFIDWIGDIEGAMDALGWTSASLVGHSLGGGIISIFAGTFPARVEKIALLESLGPLSNEAEGIPQRLEQHLVERRRLAGKAAPVYESLEHVVKLRRQATPLTEPAARLLVERGMKQVPGGITWRSDPKLRLPSPMRFTEKQVDAFLKRIECPVMAVRAREGMVMDPEIVKSRAACVGQLAIHQVEGHHHVHMDHPERVAPLIRDFFE